MALSGKGGFKEYRSDRRHPYEMINYGLDDDEGDGKPQRQSRNVFKIHVTKFILVAEC